MATTALTRYQRLEAAGLWRADEHAQRLDVIVSVGEATLTITDMRDRVQTHWSIAAIARANPGQRPAIYYPDGDPGETLELPEDEAEMIAAIETLRSAVARQRLAHLHRATGPACRGPGGRAALSALARRLPPREGTARFEVVRKGIDGVLRLPGGTMLIAAALVEEHEEPDVVAGHIIAAYLRAEAQDPLDRLLEELGPVASLRLLVTGRLTDGDLQDHAETLVQTPRDAPSVPAMLDGFAHWQVRATPYARVTESTGTALEQNDPFGPSVTPPPPILADGDWLRLQAICG